MVLPAKLASAKCIAVVFLFIVLFIKTKPHTK